MDSFLTEVNQKIQNILDHLRGELATIRAGRANPSLIENVPVQAYGGNMKLVELGTISSPQPNLLTVQVWDVSIVKDVIKAIQEANLGLNPSFEGQLIRLPIPPLTSERREEYIKLSRNKAEEAKVEVRQLRQKERDKLEEQKKNDEFGEDELERRFKLLQETVDKAIDQIEQMSKEKEEELIRV